MGVVVKKIACWLSAMVLGVLACEMSTRAEGVAPPQAATYSKDEILRSVSAGRDRLKSLLVECVFVTRNPETGLPDSKKVRMVLAGKGSLRFASYIHSTPELPEKLDYDRAETYFTGTTFDTYYPLRRYYETSRRYADMRFSYVIRAPFFFGSLGWWPPNDPNKPPSQNHPLFLHEVLASNSYKLLPFQEQVQGVFCHVVEWKGIDRLWLDAKRGFCIRHRETYTGNPPALSNRCELSDYREETPGIWIPRIIRHFLYRFDKAGTPIEKDTTCTVERVEVNQLQDDFFHFTPPPGTLVENHDSGEISQIPGGLSFLDEIIDLERARTNIYANYLPASTGSSLEAPWQVYILGAIVGGLGLMNGYLSLRFLRPSTRPRRRGRVSNETLPR